jgi:hypothetical protein
MPETNSERFVPLTELHEHPANKHINWQLPLPEYSGVHELAFDIQAANRIARLGALAEVTFQPGRQIQEDQPNIGGMGGNDTATSAISISMLRKKQRPPLDLRCVHDETGHVPYFSDVTVEADIDTISQQLSARGQLRNGSRWAAELNKVAHSGLRRAALKNTTHNNTVDGITYCFMMPLTTLVYTGLLCAMDFGMKLPLNFEHCVYGGSLMAAGTIGKVMIELMQDEGDAHSIPRKELPYSVLPFGVDRLAIVGASALRNRKLIRHMPSLAKGQA